jgi:phage baseplate assembly protein W
MSSPQTPSTSIRGLTYPLTIVNGNLAVSTDYSLITQQIRSVVETRFYERVMRADYGVGDHTLDVINPGLINSEFQTSIAAYVKNLTSLTVQGDWVSQGDNGVYTVYILYSINGVPQAPINFSLSN